MVEDTLYDKSSLHRNESLEQSGQEARTSYILHNRQLIDFRNNILKTSKMLQ